MIWINMESCNVFRPLQASESFAKPTIVPTRYNGSPFYLDGLN